jgi:hypothetical protein
MLIDEAVEKILWVSKVLDQQAMQNPQEKRTVATMYYLASQRIKYAFGQPITAWREGQRQLYQLSGFKNPLNILFDHYEDCERDCAEKIRGSLIFLSHHFDYRVSELLSEDINNKLYLSSQAKIRIADASEYGVFVRDFY